MAGAAYMRESHGSWLALDFADRARQAELSTRYGVRGIPMLVVVNSDGSVLTSEGREDVSSGGTYCYPRWIGRWY